MNTNDLNSPQDWMGIETPTESASVLNHDLIWLPFQLKQKSNSKKYFMKAVRENVKWRILLRERKQGRLSAQEIIIYLPQRDLDAASWAMHYLKLVTLL